MGKNMNRLYMNRFYTSGPIDRVSDRGIGWRKDIEEFLFELNCGSLNPCDKPTTYANELEEDFKIRYEYKTLKNYKGVKKMMKPIVGYDLRMVDVADALICYVNTDVHMCGTYFECALASSQRKPVIFMCEQGKENMPCWLFGQFNHNLFFNNWNEVKDYLNDIDSGFYSEEELMSDGWRMFNYNKVYNL
jgi:nucleoside 2-deoxyribosyltransferase